MIIGSDVEFFIKNSYGEVIPAFDIIDNKKDNPVKKNNIQLYYDNVLLEFNIEPCKDLKSFITSISSGINFAESIIRPNYLDLSSSTFINADYLKNKKANEFGCELEYNAYNFLTNKNIEKIFKSTSLRTSGGHIHISGKSGDAIEDKTLAPIFIYMLDLFLGITSVLVVNDKTEIDRRKLFGKAGSYRVKPYGLEYRVLSSWWTAKPEYCFLVYKLTEFVYNFMNDKLWQKFWTLDESKLSVGDQKNAYSCFGYDHEDICKTINTCDYMKAQKYYNFISNFLPSELEKEIMSIQKNRSHDKLP